MCVIRVLSCVVLSQVLCYLRCCVILGRCYLCYRVLSYLLCGVVCVVCGGMCLSCVV